MTEGEAWARELLTELQDGRFRPRAWLRFLRRSFERAAVRRRERGSEHRAALLLAAGGAAAWLAAGLAVLGWGAAAGAGWWLLVCLMLDWHLGMLERPDGRPLGRLGAANTLSLLRAGVAPALLLVPPVAAGALLFAAGVSDAADGPIARRRDEVTRLGFWLDGVVDTLVLGAAAIAAPLPAWLVALVLVRFGLPWLAVGVAYFGRAQAPTREHAISGRFPGLVLLAGLVLALLGYPAGAWLVGTGALSGLGTFALTVAYSWLEMIRNPFIASHEETGESLSDLVEGELTGWRRWRIVRHLARCEHCQAVYRSLLRTLDALRELGSAEPEPQPVLADAILERIRREPSPP